MKCAVKKVDALKREMHFEVPQDRVRQKMEEVYQEIGKVAKVKGFRPGKVPRHVLETEHGALAKEETIKKLIPEVYQEGLEKEKIIPLDLPDVMDVSLKDDILKFKATVEIKPEVQVGSYKGLAVKRKSSQVTEEEIAKTLEYFQKSAGKEGETGGLDDSFARGLGFPNLDAFKQSLTRQLEIDKDRQNRMDVENQIVEALLKDAKLSVPQDFVKKQIEHRVHEARHRLESQGMKEEEILKKEEELRKNLQKPVEKEVKVYLIFDKIAEMEKIEIKQGENLVPKVMEFLLKEAAWE